MNPFSFNLSASFNVFPSEGYANIIGAISNRKSAFSFSNSSISSSASWSSVFNLSLSICKFLISVESTLFNSLVYFFIFFTAVLRCLMAVLRSSSFAVIESSFKIISCSIAPVLGLMSLTFFPKYLLRSSKWLMSLWRSLSWVILKTDFLMTVPVFSRK